MYCHTTYIWSNLSFHKSKQLPQKVYKIKKPDDVQTKVKGRGGTAFTPVIEYINNDKYFRDSLLIYFTDGYGEAKIPRPYTYRNLWVILGDSKSLSLKQPYGAVVSMDVSKGGN